MKTYFLLLALPLLLFACGPAHYGKIERGTLINTSKDKVIQFTVKGTVAKYTDSYLAEEKAGADSIASKAIWDSLINKNPNATYQQYLKLLPPQPKKTFNPEITFTKLVTLSPGEETLIVSLLDYPDTILRVQIVGAVEPKQPLKPE